MTIAYDPAQLQVAFILKWRGTIFPLVLADPLFWLLATVHVALLTYQNLSSEPLPPMDWNAASVSLGLLTFFVIFYGNHCYARYFELFGHCIGVLRTLNVWAWLVKNNFSHMSPERCWNITRPMLAAMQVHYATLHSDEDDIEDTNLCVSESEWKAIRDDQLLTKDECEHLANFKGNLPVLLSTWALGEVKAALLEEQIDQDSEHESRETRYAVKSGQLTSWTHLATFNRFEDVAREFTGFTNATIEQLAQPVPFPYFHILKLLLLVSLSILGYTLIDLLDANFYLSVPVFFTTEIILIGLQQVAIGMSDPFGDDDVDFDLEGFKQTAYNNTIAMLTETREPMGNTLDAAIKNPIAKSARVAARKFASKFGKRRLMLPKAAVPGLPPSAAVPSTTDGAGSRSVDEGNINGRSSPPATSSSSANPLRPSTTSPTTKLRVPGPTRLFSPGQQSKGSTSLLETPLRSSAHSLPARV